MVRSKWLAVLVVHPEERDVECIAGIGEVVRIAAEEPHLQFWCHHEAKVGVAFEHVRRRLSAIPEGDHIHLDTGILTAVLFGDALVDLLGDLLPGRGPGCICHDAFQRRVHFGRHVHDSDELVRVKILYRPLFRQRRRVEAVVEQLLTLCAHLCDALTTTVMVGHHQPVRRDEGC